MKKLVLLFVFLSIIGCEDGSVVPDDPIPDDSSSILSQGEIDNLRSVGMDTAHISNMIVALENNDYPNFHSILISKDGRTVLNRYFAGQDERWSSNLGLVNHNENSLHDVRSVTKSVVALCIGIAIERGEIENVDQLLFDFFPEFDQYNTGAKSNISIQHLLTMTAGFEWDETISYNNPANSETQMFNSSNPVEFVLSRNMVDTPGTVWNYNGGATQLLASIIQKASGMDIYQYARMHLLEPLGISRSEWGTYPRSSLPGASYGLRLRSLDLLKIGVLLLNGGNWEGNQIIESGWIDDSFTNHVSTIYSGDNYGYQFWLWNHFIAENNTSIPLACAFGNGDQRIFVDQTHQIVVVTTAGNYNQFEENNSVTLLRDFIYPAVY